MEFITESGIGGYHRAQVDAYVGELRHAYQQMYDAHIALQLRHEELHARCDKLQAELTAHYALKEAIAQAMARVQGEEKQQQSLPVPKKPPAPAVQPQAGQQAQPAPPQQEMQAPPPMPQREMQAAPPPIPQREMQAAPPPMPQQEMQAAPPPIPPRQIFQPPAQAFPFQPQHNPQFPLNQQNPPAAQNQPAAAPPPPPQGFGSFIPFNR